jgi:hypothetical protein
MVKVTRKELGEIKQGTSKEVIFTILQDISEIERIENTCSCTAHSLDGNKVKVIYTPKKIESLQASVEKEICIMYKNENIEILVIKAIITQ